MENTPDTFLIILAIVSIIVTIIGIIVGLLPYAITFFRQCKEYRLSSENLKVSIEGSWYSAELDLKQNQKTNAILEIEIIRHKSGNRIEIITKRQLDNLNNIETAWHANGKVVTTNTLLLDWQGTIEGSTRYGNAFMQFIENNRAVGYWIGYGSNKALHPVYGYCIFSRNEDDLRELAELALTKFTFVDIKELIEKKASKEKRGKKS
jgi:hypothetical protein